MGKTTLIVVLILMAIGAVIGGILFPYSINTWLVYFGKPASLKFYHGALIGFIPALGQICIPLAIITWIAMLFLV